MNEFYFNNEMVYGKKHLNKLVFDKEKYNFVKLVTDLFDIELNNLHNYSETKYELFTEIGKDSHTEYHKKFYSKIDSNWKEMEETYTNFISEVVLPYLGLDEALYQVYPNFRVQLPNNVAVVIDHYDSDENHRHPNGEVNFICALTDMYDTNTIWAEKHPRWKDYIPMKLSKGDCISFNGNKCSHHNKINETGKTRVSFDFRILPLNLYNDKNETTSVTTNKQYVEGGYYKRIQSKTNKIYKARDIWDKEKEKFNNTMIKYNVKDAWDIVDLFEKKIAEYSGSKYAVSVDNCTNAMFLCLKYLNYTDEVIIPSKTYCSVPCTIINAGCKVRFEDREWSGAYQLKPTPIYDGAVRFKKGMYKPNTFHCLSFHIRKHLPIGKGGMILCDDVNAYNWFRVARYEGRHISDGTLYKNEKFDMIGWNMYMTPEQASRGLELFERMGDDNPDQESSGTCLDLSNFPVYENPKIITNQTSYKKDNEKFYSYDYWFNNEEHNNWDQGGENYYVNRFYEEIIFKLDIPTEGKILVLGTHNCVSFDKLCKHFGYDRVIGYDLYNPNNHPNVQIRDCLELKEEDNYPIAFCHNDLGNFSTTPKLKLHGQKWAANNIVSGGYMLGNNNFNRVKVKVEELMTDYNFENILLEKLKDKYNLSSLEKERIEGYMISKKI